MLPKSPKPRSTVPPIALTTTPSSPTPGGQPSPSPLSLSTSWSTQISSNDKSPVQRTYHFSPRPKSVVVRANPGDISLESPSPFKLPKPRQTGMGSPEGGPVSPRFTLTDSRRPIPRLDLFNDLRPMPELPPVPDSPPGPSRSADDSSDDSSVEGEIYIEFLVFEQYRVVDLPPVDEPSSTASSPLASPVSSPTSTQWPSSPRPPGDTISPRAQFLGTRPRDNHQ